jgi:protein-tyrosine phosphatase
MTHPKNPAIRILMVCLGNICRSPTAEGVLRQLAAREAPELRLEIDSAGTAAYHIGKAPDPRSQRAARRRGIDLGGLRARQVCARDFDDFDLILAMDHDNLQDLERIRPPGSRARLQLFLDYSVAHPSADHPLQRDVPDPYAGDEEDFERVLELTTAAARGLIASLQQRAQQPVEGAGQGD